jgi:hypothetical protein
MGAAIARHEAILRDVIAHTGGVVFKTVGDAIYAAFASALDALRAALEGQRAIRAEPWDIGTPLQVRMALHSGVVQERNGDYFGLPLSRIAGLLAAAHPKDSDPTSHIPAWVTSHGAAFHPHVHPIGRYAEPSTVAMLCSFADAYDGTLLLEGNKVSYTVFIKCALLYSSQWQMVSTEGLSERGNHAKASGCARNGVFRAVCAQCHL